MSVSADSSTATQTDSVSMTNTEEDATLADTEVEYLTQYFGFLPQSFMNGSKIFFQSLCTLKFPGS